MPTDCGEFEEAALLCESDSQNRKEKTVRYHTGHGFSASAAFTVRERFLHDPEGNG